MNYHTCFMCNDHIEFDPKVLGPINHFKDDHAMQFSSTHFGSINNSSIFVFSSLDLFDEIYHPNTNGLVLKNYIITSKFSSQIFCNNKYVNILDNMYWLNFKQLKSTIDKLLVFS